MKIRIVGANQIEVEHDNMTVLFSYGTPIVALFNGDLFASDEKHSATTAKHASQYRAATLRDNFEHEASELQERYAKDIQDWNDSEIAEETLIKFKKDKYR